MVLSLIIKMEQLLILGEESEIHIIFFFSSSMPPVSTKRTNTASPLCLRRWPNRIREALERERERE